MPRIAATRLHGCGRTRNESTCTCAPCSTCQEWIPREKGIDVQLAIDFVVMAVRREYDVGILFSTDTDLKPALDAVCDLRPNGGPVAEVAAWSGPNAQPRRIGASRPRQVPCHWLNAADFVAVADNRNYAQP
jgi:NYN domain